MKGILNDYKIATLYLLLQIFKLFKFPPLKKKKDFKQSPHLLSLALFFCPSHNQMICSKKEQKSKKVWPTKRQFNKQKIKCLRLSTSRDNKQKRMGLRGENSIKNYNHGLKDKYY